MSKKRTAPRESVSGIVILAITAIVLALFAPGWACGADENGALLAGSVKSDSGEQMTGVTASAKTEGHTITTSVFTDQQGDYYFPAMAAGTYEVCAQADTFETAHATVSLTATRHQDFMLK